VSTCALIVKSILQSRAPVKISQSKVINRTITQIHTSLDYEEKLWVNIKSIKKKERQQQVYHKSCVIQ